MSIKNLVTIKIFFEFFIVCPFSSTNFMDHMGKTFSSAPSFNECRNY